LFSKAIDLLSAMTDSREKPARQRKKNILVFRLNWITYEMII
jgi:hypothetical protein